MIPADPAGLHAVQADTGTIPSGDALQGTETPQPWGTLPLGPEILWEVTCAEHMPRA